MNEGEVGRRLERFTATAKEAGFKLTHQRLEIFREVAASVEHPDAETVYRAVHPRMPTVSLDTVYRTLALLAELGMVKTLGARRERVRYDANLDEHHHYVCMRCGLTRDFNSAELSAMPIPEAARKFGRVIGAQVEVRGVCASCQRKAAGSRMGRRGKGRDERSGK